MSNDSNQEVTDHGRPISRAFGIKGIVLGLAALIAICGAVVLSFGLPTGSSRLVLADAFVRGAVSRIGTAEDARITKLHVKLGDRVSRGDPLVELSRDRLLAERDASIARVEQFRAALDEARAADSIASERARIETQRAKMRLNEADALIAREQQDLDLLRQQVERSRNLVERGVRSQVELDKRRSELKKALADLDYRRAQRDVDEQTVALLQIDEREADVRKAELDQLSERLVEAEADLAKVEARLKARTLTALDDGIVVEVPSRPGASVGTDDPILSIWDPRRTWMFAYATESDLDFIQVGDPTTVRIDTLDTVISGVVARILIAPDGEERTLPGQPVSPLLAADSQFGIQVEFDADPYAEIILPGMSGSIEIALPDGSNRSFLFAGVQAFLPW